MDMSVVKQLLSTQKKFHSGILKLLEENFQQGNKTPYHIL